ncbi:MAG: hypothetical protein ACTSVV_07950 [Promethearchaeota archaeon]
MKRKIKQVNSLLIKKLIDKKHVIIEINRILRQLSEMEKKMKQVKEDVSVLLDYLEETREQENISLENNNSEIEIITFRKLSERENECCRNCFYLRKIRILPNTYRFRCSRYKNLGDLTIADANFLACNKFRERGKNGN